MQRDAAAVSGFEIYVADWLCFNTKVEAVVAGQCGAAGLHAGVEVAFAIGGFAVGGAGRRGGSAEDPAEYGLRAPRGHIVGGSGEAQRASVNFGAGFGLEVVTESYEGAMKILGVVNGISHA
jgi:hypothetical protein